MSSILVYVMIGIGLGTITGLIPGLHVNNIVLILLLLTPRAPLNLSCAIMACAITHTFVNFIPGAFLGAPDEDTAVAILPAHRML